MLAFELRWSTSDTIDTLEPLLQSFLLLSLALFASGGSRDHTRLIPTRVPQSIGALPDYSSVKAQLFSFFLKK